MDGVEVQIDRVCKTSGRGGFPSIWFAYIASCKLPTGEVLQTGECQTKTTARRAMRQKLKKHQALRGEEQA